MVQAGNQELTELFIQFYRNYYRDEIGSLAQHYPDQQRSLYIEYGDLHTFEPDLAEDVLDNPDQLREYAEEALRLYDLPADISLGQAHVRVQGLPDTVDIQDIRVPDGHIGRLIAVEGIVRKSSDVSPMVVEAAFECQRCGTMTYILQGVGEFEQPHECQGCERQGPFRINLDQSELVDHRTIQLLEDPVSLADGNSPQKIRVELNDDIADEAVAGDRIRVNGVLHLKQENDGGKANSDFKYYIDAVSIESLRDEESHRRLRHQSVAITDLDTYTDLAAVALGTLPEDAREEETKAKLVTPFVEALGWNKFDGSEVRLEYTDSKTGRRPDYALFGPGSELPDVIVEAKQLGTNLDEKEQQLYDYLRVFSAEWGVLTNGEEFYVYQFSTEKDLPEKITELQMSDVGQADIVDSLRHGSYYE